MFLKHPFRQVALSAVTLLMAAVLSPEVSEAARKQPNIVLILADDLGYGDLGCFGQKVLKTPRLDAMAAEGIRFTQFYAGCTVCAPSRSVLMTGKHMGRTVVRGNSVEPIVIQPGQATVASEAPDGGASQPTSRYGHVLARATETCKAFC